MPGRWAGGFRAWDEHGVYLATGRGGQPGRVLRVPADGAPRAGRRLVPVRRPPDRGLYRTARNDRVDRAAAGGAGRARHAGRRARPRAQQPGRRGHPRGRRACEAADQRCSRARPAGRGDDHGRPVHRARRAAARARAPGGGPGPAGARPTGRRRCRTGWTTTGSSATWLIAPPLAAAGADIAWCERAAGGARRGHLEPGLEWVASTLVGDRAARRGEGVDAARSPTWSPR